MSLESVYEPTYIYIYNIYTPCPDESWPPLYLSITRSIFFKLFLNFTLGNNYHMDTNLQICEEIGLILTKILAF